MNRLKTTNPELIALIRDLKKKSNEKQAELWRYLAERLSASKKSRIAVNISRLNRYTKGGETIAVPGKVLGAGKADHPMTIAAFAFSEIAELKIQKAKGNCLSIRDLMERNPKGSNVRVMG